MRRLFRLPRYDRVPQAIQRSLAVSLKEVVPAGVMLGVVETYVVPLGLFCHATTAQIGVLVSLPQLLGAGALLAAVPVVRRIGSRLHFAIAGASLQAAMLFLVAGLALLDFPGRLTGLIALIVAYRVLFQLMIPPFGSLMSEYLPPGKRGGYFGLRTRILWISQIAGTALAGVILFIAGPRSAAVGFFLVFLMAACARFLSSRLLVRMTDLPLLPEQPLGVSSVALDRQTQRNLVRYAAYVAGLLFATFLAAPYFSVYMLRDLRFDYLTYTAVQLAGMIAGLVAAPVWGRHADVVGNVKVLKVTGALIPVVPLLWLCASHPAYLIAIEVCSGVLWAGFNLCLTNFIYDAVSPHQRIRVLAFCNAINGLAMCGGAFLGGLLAERMPPLLGARLLSLIGLSGFLRLAVYLLLAHRFHEMRSGRQKVSSRQLWFSILGLRPIVEVR